SKHDRSSDDFDNAREATEDFLSLSGAAPALAAEPNVTCPMCGMANDTLALRCLACGEVLQQPQETEYPASRSLRFGSIWSDAWRRWKANLGVLVASTAIAGGILTSIYVLMIFACLIVPALFSATGAVPDDKSLFVVIVFALGGSFYFAIFAAYA